MKEADFERIISETTADIKAAFNLEKRTAEAILLDKVEMPVTVAHRRAEKSLQKSSQRD